MMVWATCLSHPRGTSVETMTAESTTIPHLSIPCPAEYPLPSAYINRKEFSIVSKMKDDTGNTHTHRTMRSTAEGWSERTGRCPSLRWSSKHSCCGRNRILCTTRVVLVLFLCIAASVLGYMTYYFLSNAERKLAETKFESIAHRALTEAALVTLAQRDVVTSMASVISVHYSDANWPFVTIQGYEKIARDILKIGRSTNLGFAPLVLPEQLDEFEEFMYSYWEKRFPNQTVARHSFGRGVFAVDRKLNTTDNRYRDNGNSSLLYRSPNKVLFPVTHVAEGIGPTMMLNAHSQPVLGYAIDRMIACSEMRRVDDPETACGVLSKMQPYLRDPSRGTISRIYQPIFTSQGKLVAYTSSPIIWDQIFENLFEDSVSGLDCVVSSETEQHTFTIDKGQATARGGGDLHQSKHNKYQMNVTIADGKSPLYTEDSPSYSLHLYPRDEFFESYSTNNATAATTIAVGCILLTSLLFFLYDYFVQREFSAKKQLLAAKRSWMRFVSHEVRTPLNSVCLGLRLMQEDMAEFLSYSSVEQVEKGENFLRKEIEWFAMSSEVLTSTQVAVNVLNDLLNYDKIESGTFRLELTQVSVWKLAEALVTEFKLPAKKKGIKLALSFERGDYTGDDESPASIPTAENMPDNVRAIGESVRIAQVLRNLVSNAIKFTPEGGSIAVRVEYIEDAQLTGPKEFELANGTVLSLFRCGRLRVSVHDTGAGMSQEQLNMLFREGLQFNAGKLQGGQGSGFGLCFAKGIVELHDGRIHVESEGIGRGSTFILTLPLYDSPQHQRGNMDTEKEEKWSVSSENFASLSVLVVDDAFSNRKLLSRLLENAGHRVDQAENGQIALDMVQAKKENGESYDTVLLDYEMPRMNGPCAVKELRRLGFDVFVVGITGNMLAEDTEYFCDCGANAVLPKPFRMTDLKELWVEYGVADQI